MVAEMTQPASTVETWLQDRLSMVGASESPAILGEGYKNESAWTVYQRKVGEAPPDEDESEALEWGREMQPVVLRMFTKRTGINVEDLGPFTIQRHPDFPFIGATLDGLAYVDGRKAVVEAKNVGQYRAADWKDDLPPLRVQIQTQQQMLAADAELAFVAACVGGNKLEWRQLERNDRFLAALVKTLREFWTCVETRTPPPVDGSAATARAIAALYPKDTGATVPLKSEALRWAAEKTVAAAIAKEMEAAVQAADNQIKAAIGEASYGDLPPCSDEAEILGEARNRLLAAAEEATLNPALPARYSWKHQSRKGYVVAPAEFRVLRSAK